MLSDFWLGIVNLKKLKALKKNISEEFMPIAWHPKRWYNFCMLEDEKKETKPIFTSNGFNAYSLRVLGHFHT